MLSHIYILNVLLSFRNVLHLSENDLLYKMDLDNTGLINKKWYVLYTRSRFEKKVLKEMEQLGVECYLPLHRKLKQWSDRKKWVEEPLFRSYIFIKIHKDEYYKVLEVNGVINFISFEGRAAIVRDDQIEILKRILFSDTEFIVSNDEINPGTEIEIIYGSLKGLKGQLIKYKSKKKVIVKIESINHSLLLNIGRQFIKKI